MDEESNGILGDGWYKERARGLDSGEVVLCFKVYTALSNYSFMYKLYMILTPIVLSVILILMLQGLLHISFVVVSMGLYFS